MNTMDKWKNLLYKQVKMNQALSRKGITNPDATLFDELCKHMTSLGYDVPKLIKSYKLRLQ
tara:strand:- start:1777 stop:1959 length:183 start_codon:yes stop_codon:yes gene_type:complete